jgi:hypothetical protein
VLLRFVVELTPGQTGLCPRRSRCRINRDLFHETQVNHQPAIEDGYAGDIMTAGADCRKNVFSGGEPDSSNNIGRPRAARNGGRPSVDHAVPYLASGIIPRGLRCKNFTAKVRL